MTLLILITVTTTQLDLIEAYLKYITLVDLAILISVASGCGVPECPGNTVTTLLPNGVDELRGRVTEKGAVLITGSHVG